jgi:hypothetical protein
VQRAAGSLAKLARERLTVDAGSDALEGAN